MQPTYRAAPAFRCYAPPKVFRDAQDALDFARAAADAYRVGYTVWRVLAGRLKRVAALAPCAARA